MFSAVAAKLRSASSIAGSSDAMAERAAAGRRAHPDIPDKLRANFRLDDRLRPTCHVYRRAGLQQRAVHQVTDKRGVDMKLLHRCRCAEAHLPAERFFAGCNALAPLRELRRHAALDARVFPRVHLWLSGCTW